ncbi:MAG: dihydroneopterin aldolase [Bacteroidales bacterium]|jgi:dihydroneopterin aldolase|nr:dihydroneopterin aldolase [Bacteroidales bacterium]
MMGKIFLNGMEFHAFHGCLPQERQAGNRFVVDVEIETSMDAAGQSDNIDDTVNYANVYEFIRQEMEIPSNLLEHLSTRILERIFVGFPQIQRAEVKLSKCNPPMMGKMQSVSVSRHKVQTSVTLA